MNSKRIGFITFLLWLVTPWAAFAQAPSWLDISPGAIFQAPGSPSCYTITVGDGAYMTVDMRYTFQGGDPQEILGWLTLDGNGQAQICADGSSSIGQYYFIGVRNSYEPWWGYTSTYAGVSISAPSPVIYSLGSGGDNWDAIWISGTRFQQDSRVYVYSADWSTYQIFWGPAWGNSPGVWVAEDGSLMTLQVTDVAVRNSFGNAGVYVLVVNSTWTPSEWAWTQSPPPSISYGDAGCDDLYCIWMIGVFPLNASVDFRPHGQSSLIPDSYDGLYVTSSLLSLALNAGVHFTYDTAGLDAWVTNALFPNWSGAYYLPPKDRAVIGSIDGTVLSGLQYFLYGWACAKTYAGSIAVDVFVGGPPGTGTLRISGVANQSSEAGVATACNSTGSNYRFSIPIPHSIIQDYGNQPMYVRANSPFGLANLLIGNSGTFPVPGADRSVKGAVSGVVLENQQYYLRGWACAKTNPASISVRFYAGDPSGFGTLVTTESAEQSSDPTTTSECNSGTTHYGFSILLSLALRQQYGGLFIYVAGISPFGFPDSLLTNSGSLKIPLAVATSSKEYIYLGDRILAVDTTNLP